MELHHGLWARSGVWHGASEVRVASVGFMASGAAVDP